MHYKINLAGSFNGKLLNEEAEIEFPTPPTVKNVMEALNKMYNINAFSERNLKKSLIVVLINGEKQNPKDLKKIVQIDDVVTILQPIMGG
jgi:molybdopterin converting factor small subunit